MRILRNFCIACVRVYRWTLAPLFISFGVQCRFTPSCSEFAEQALEKHGAARGVLLAAHRVLCCHPFCKGGLDPVPDTLRFWRRHG